MFLRRTKTVPWGPLVRFVPAFAFPKNRNRIETWRLGLPAPLVARNHTRERVTGVDMVQNLLMLFCYFMYKIIT